MGKTITEKIFEAHQKDAPSSATKVLSLDVVMCHEITTPPAILDLQTRGRDKVFSREKIKVVIDHVTPSKDSKSARQARILRDWANRHNISDFFDIGANGVCHALFPEKGFIRPGYTVIMGDSHTCTHGAFGAFAAGVGTTDLEVGILKGVGVFRIPETIKIEIVGKRPEAVFAKDIILEVIRCLTVDGATNQIIEFHGSVVNDMDMEERMTLCNMAVEAGATSGICMPDRKTVDYLWPFIHHEFSEQPEKAEEAYTKWVSDDTAKYKKCITIDVSQLEPLATVGYKPDQVKKIRELRDVKIHQIYIGSCTNGRISDLREAAKIVKNSKLAAGVRGIISPATPAIFRQAMKENLVDIFLDAGYCLTNPTCGACLGMSNGVLDEGEVCASTTNRNFNGRMGKGGMVHLMSPASAAASGITGYLTDPRDIMNKE